MSIQVVNRRDVGSERLEALHSHMPSLNSSVVLQPSFPVLNNSRNVLLLSSKHKTPFTFLNINTELLFLFQHEQRTLSLSSNEQKQFTGGTKRFKNQPP